METREYRTLDKAKWGTGPWQDEPDKRQWQDEVTKLPCLLVRGPHGALCGYVGVPKGHPLHGIDYGQSAPLPAEIVRSLLEKDDCAHLYSDEMEAGAVEVQSIIRVHGGVTFANGCGHGDNEAQGICHGDLLLLVK